MIKKWLFSILLSVGMCGIAFGGDITDTGKSDADVFTYYTNIKNRVNDLMERARSQCLSSAGLTSAASTSTVKTLATGSTTVMCNGYLIELGSSTNFPTLVGDIATATPYQVYCFFVGSGSVLTTQAGTQAATLAKVGFPSIPTNKALVGFLIVGNGSSSSFLPGTESTDAGGIARSFVNTQGMIEIGSSTTITAPLSLTGL